MKVMKPSFKIDEDDLDGEKMIRAIERRGRICYKSEDRITPDSARAFIKAIIKRGHESVLEHEKISVIIICDRGVTHEIVRHRIGDYSQESTRYCKYDEGIGVIDPFFFVNDEKKYEIWFRAMVACEKAYLGLLEAGASPQEARSVLPNSLKTEIAVTYNLRQWRHFFKLRCAKAAHPQMREITLPLLEEFKKLIPVVFEDINPDEL